MFHEHDSVTVSERERESKNYYQEVWGKAKGMVNALFLVCMLCRVCAACRRSWNGNLRHPQWLCSSVSSLTRIEQGSVNVWQLPIIFRGAIFWWDHVCVRDGIHHFFPVKFERTFPRSPAYSLRDIRGFSAHVDYFSTNKYFFVVCIILMSRVKFSVLGTYRPVCWSRWIHGAVWSF